MFFTEEKIEERIKELVSYRYRDTHAIRDFHLIADVEGRNGAYPPEAGEGSVIHFGDCWKGTDVYHWLKAAVEIPPAWAGRKIVGIFDFAINEGFESLLFVNGHPYQGVDSNHKEVFFSSETLGHTLDLQFRIWTRLGGQRGYRSVQENKLKVASISWLDETVDDLYYTATVALETLKVLEQNRPERWILLNALDKAVVQIDWSKPGSGGFYKSVAIANEMLNSELQTMENHHPVRVHCIGHTHIDVAWLWRLKHTREKTARSFSTVLRLMEMFPEYIFLQTQPQLYEYIKSDYPEIYKQIRERVKEGRWEAEGGMWLEADCNLISGESMVRQLLLGSRFMKMEFGIPCEYLWLPDVFGYSWALPQILKKSGIRTFMTTKISWNQYNRMPHDTFWWRGLDGTEILTHFITTPNPNRESKDWRYTYNGKILSQTVQGSWDSYRDKAINQDLLLSYGYGDGGGGPNREMLEKLRRVGRMPGIPHVRTGKAGDYFRRLHERISKTEGYVHTWDGELYLEYHRGTYTSQAYSKRMNRKLEIFYREAEWLSVLAAAQTMEWSSYPQEALNQGWKIILRNQFHDIIPGSSIREVYEDSRLEYQEAERIGNAARSLSVQSLCESSSAKRTFTIFNSLPWDRSDIVAIDLETGMENGRWLDRHGNPLHSVKSHGSWSVLIPHIPSMGFTTVTFQLMVNERRNSDLPMAEGLPFQVQEKGIQTPFYELQWDATGKLSRLYDRKAERNILEEGECGNVLQVFEDKPMQYDAWDIDIYYQQKMKVIDELASVQITETNPLRAVVRFSWKYLDSTIQQDMVLYAHSRRIDYRTIVDWHERQQLLKVAFPVAIRATEATYDIQFGNVKRPTHWNTSWDYARFETVGHQWADLSERDYGVSLINDCKYGYDIKDNVLRLSLIKSAIKPDHQADQGNHEFIYSILPHEGDWLKGSTVQESWQLNAPLTYVQGAGKTLEQSLFRVSADSLMIDGVKKAEDSDHLVLRLHDFSGSRRKVSIKSELSVISWQECDLMERAIGEEIFDSQLNATLLPYEIKTYLIQMGGPYRAADAAVGCAHGHNRD